MQQEQPQQQPQQQQDLELFSLKWCIPPANRHGKMAKKNEVTRGNQHSEPNFTNYANFVLCRIKKKLNFRSNFTKIRTNFK